MHRFRDDNDDHERRRPLAMYAKILAPMFALPAIGIWFHIDYLSACIGGLVGILVLAVLIQRPTRSAKYPVRIVLAAITAQLVSMAVLSNLTGMGPFALSSRAATASSDWNPAVSRTEFSTEVKTLSVILPCANEGIFAVKTARSIGERTPAHVLEEIIVVDDGSTPPLSEYFKEHGADVLEKYTVRFVRHETFTGLINAKKQGGDRATGDVLAFLDCHVLPRKYEEGKFWSDGIMSRIAGNYKRIVVPSITDLDPDKWDEIGRPNGVAKCYLSLDVDFRWFDSEDDFVPIMSGGLLAMSRQWWVETGGYDTGMIGWGGENIDQSLRAWLCGGEIVQATDSHVAHMWRVNARPNTKAKYTVPEGSVSSNRYRAAMAWFDDYIEKVHEFPTFSKFVPPTQAPLPNIDSILEVKERLQCKPFQWFIDRFSKVYFDAGVLPATIFRIMDESSRLCLARRKGTDRERQDVVAVACSVEDPMQLWHRANRDGEKCCSGFRGYNSMYCLNGAGSEFGATECNTYGKNTGQLADIVDGEVKFSRSNVCASVAASANDVVVQELCDETKMLREFTRVAVTNPDGFGNGLFQIKEVTTGMCMTAFSPSGGAEDMGSTELAVCDSHSTPQMFNITNSFAPGFVQIRTWENLCLDTADGKRVLAYSCYDDSVANDKQVFAFDETTRTIRNKHHPTCLSVADKRVDFSATTVPVSIGGCVRWDGVVKLEQQFSKSPSLRDVTSAFLVKAGGRCLSAQTEGDDVGLVKCPQSKEEETDDMLWYFETLHRLKNRKQRKCLDGNDHKKPILYPCYSTDNDNQEWSDPGLTGGIIKNGRAQMCLDYNPVIERKVTVSSTCKTGAKSTMFGSEESKEMQIYRFTKAKASGSVNV